MAKKKLDDMKVKKKRWMQIISPAFNDQKIGETHVLDPQNALGKHIKVNLMSLVGDPRKQNIDVLFVTDKMKGETGVLAQVIGYQIQGPALRKLVRRGKTKIQDSFYCKTGDGKTVVVKLFTITRYRVNKAVASKIRLGLKQLVVNKVSSSSFDSLVQEIVQSKFQRELKNIANQVYPIRLVELNTVKVIQKTKIKVENQIPAEQLILQPKKKEDKSVQEKKPKKKEEESAETD